MTPTRRHAILRRVKDITLSTTLSLALLNGSAMLQSCRNNQDSEEQTETIFKQGVRTYITETAPGQFKITDEVQADPAKAGAIVNYYDGHRDTLSVEAARKLVQTDSSTRQYYHNPAGYHHHNGLANVLMWGSLGYMLGRPNYGRYQDDERRYRSGVYSNPGVYNRASRLGDRVSSSRSSRPSGGRSGFFGGRSRGFSA